MKKILLTSTLAVSLISIGCDNTGNQNQDSKDRAEEINKDRDLPKKDADFVVEAASKGMKEVEVSRVAAERAATPEVKQFAQMMIEYHTNANQELNQLASRLNIAAPQSLPEDKREDMNDLNDINGMDFDKRYMKMMVDDHEKNINKFEDAAENAESPDLKNWASTTLPKLRHHLDMARQTHDRIKDMN